MTDSSRDRRRYSDREMALILKRAATLQEQGPDAVAQEQSHTLTELERVAIEVGIDPRYVAEAAAAVDAESVGCPDDISSRANNRRRGAGDRIQ